MKLALAAIFVLALLPRVLDLGAILSPDEPRWYQNTVGFKEGLVAGDLSKLYQQPHPGITTMWLAAPVIDSDNWEVRRLPQAIFLSLLIVGVSVLATRLWGRLVGLLGGLFLALNPLFIAHSRVLSMDALLAGFLLVSVLGLLVWGEEKKRLYMIVSGAAGALAVLSKMAGVVIMPFIAMVVLAWWLFRMLTWREALLAGLVWVISFMAAFVIVFPTIITDFGYVWAGTQEFFTTEHFQQAVHALGPRWYPEAFLIWSTPLQLLGLVFLLGVWFLPGTIRYQVLVLLGFGLAFFLAMQYSIKKGDRYILPVFLIVDVVTAVSCAWLLRNFAKSFWARAAAVVMAGALLWQLAEVVRLHPHALAYRNPFFRDVAAGRTMGWGEGLDLAAQYLNAKPDAEHLLVISYYESSFAHGFKGKFTSAERLATETPQEIGGDYVVLYRTMEGRASDRWETRVLHQFSNRKPEHVIVLNGEEYAWIYNVE